MYSLFHLSMPVQRSRSYYRLLFRWMDASPMIGMFVMFVAYSSLINTWHLNIYFGMRMCSFVHSIYHRFVDYHHHHHRRHQTSCSARLTCWSCFFFVEKEAKVNCSEYNTWTIPSIYLIYIAPLVYNQLVSQHILSSVCLSASVIFAQYISSSYSSSSPGVITLVSVMIIIT